MQLYTFNLYLETALHVSGVISTHHQERIQLYLQHRVLVTPLLLPAAVAHNSTYSFMYCQPITAVSCYRVGDGTSLSI